MNKWTVGLILALLVSGYLAFSQWRSHLEARAVADQKEEQLDQLQESVERYERVLREVDEQAREDRRDLEKSIQEARLESQTERERAEENERELRQFLEHPREVEALNRLVRNFRNQKQIQEEIIGKKDSIILLLENRIAVRDSLNEDLREALELANEQKEFWEREARPGFFVNLGVELPKIAIVASASILTWEVLK